MRNFKLSALTLFICLIVAQTACSFNYNVTDKYGVFVGSSAENIAELSQYDTIVIDAEYFTAEDILLLKDKDTLVYSYLNIGSIETFRACYKEFHEHTLGDYSGWSDERWMDVSNSDWQGYIVKTADKLSAKGISGFFIDNCDVWDLYHDEAIYLGLLAIVKKLSIGAETSSLPIIINGGDAFVERLIYDSELEELSITGVNQESVFTTANEFGEMSRQNTKVTEYFELYLKNCKNNGLNVFLTEYANKSEKELISEITRYCADNGYTTYISNSRELTIQ